MTLRGEPFLDDVMTLRDGRELWFAEWGDRAGPVVVQLHGGPGSRLLAVDTAAVSTSGVRLLTLDRPGLGRSTRLPLHGLTEVAADVVELADHRGVDRFAVAGFSAGGTYALAVAALAPDRVSAVATMSSPAGPGVEDGFVAGDPGRSFVAELAVSDRAAAVDVTAAFFQQYVDDPDSFLDPSDTPPEDMFLLDDDIERQEFIDRAVRAGLAEGPHGAADDTVAHLAPWDFSLRDVRVPVHIFHGRQDVFVPIADAEHLAVELPISDLTVWDDAGHLAALQHFTEVLDRALS